MRKTFQISGVAAISAALTAVLASGTVWAFAKPCHQGMTTEVLASATWPMGAQPPLLEGQHADLIVELSIDVAPEVKNLWGLSTLIGNQYTDQGSFDLKDISAIAEFAARPELQREHCLRGPDDDGPEGDATALASCKAFILEQLEIALGDGEKPDLETTEAVRLSLVFRGKADVTLSRYGFHLGQATHALQDSFGHSFRSADMRRVRSVLNWVDWLHAGTYDEARDGFQHLSALDQCGAADEGGPERRAAAKQATAELLAAVADDRGGRAGRLERAAAVVDAWFGIEPGCTEANQWCDAPERLQTSFTGCAVGGRASSGLLAVLAVLIGLRLSRRGRWLALSVVLALGTAGTARAQGAATPPSETTTPAQETKQKEGEAKENVIPKATLGEQRTLVSRSFGIFVKGGLAIDNAALEAGVGVTYDVSKRWTVGLVADWTPWYSIETGHSTSGTTNLYAIGVFRLDVRDYLELRVTGGLGFSILMFDTWEARSGSIGPYLQISPLGVAFRMSSRLRLVVDPAEFVIPIPQTRGIPLIYRQHRFSVGLQANF